MPLAEQLLSLPGLVTLYIEPYKNFQYPVLPNIKELGVLNWFNIDINTDALATSFINLEQLYISGSEDLLPFMRRSAKLRAVEITAFKRKFLDIAALNDERKKLQPARKVTIFVEEYVYVKTKWAMASTSLDLIELRRQTSRNTVRPHSFWRQFQ